MPPYSCGVLVRFVIGKPESDFQRSVEALRELVEAGRTVVASNQVIGEAYIAVQHHYRISDTDARTALVAVLTSGLVAPMNGHSVIVALEARGGPGLFDRLIADDYSQAGLDTLTLDRRMASLPRVHRI